jgi:hypothetical protein
MALGRFQPEIFILPLLAALFLSAPQNAKGDDCPAGTVKIGEKRTETADAIIVQPLCKKINSIVASAPSPCEQKPAIQQKVRDLQSRIEKDKNAIRALHVNAIADGIEEWQTLSEKARADLMSQAFDMILVNAQVAMKAGGSLNPPSANKAISKLKSVGIDIDKLNAAIRKLAATPGKPPRAEDINAVLEGMSRGKDLASMAKAEGDTASRLEALSTVLGWYQTSPALAYLATDLSFTTASIYNNLTMRESRSQIDQLTTLSEEDLRSLKTLSKLLQDDVTTLKSNEHDLAALSLCP